MADEEHRHFAIALVDANNDGWIDLYYGNGEGDPPMDLPPSGICPDLQDPPDFPIENTNVFFLNRGDGTFTEDVAGELGLADRWNAMRHVWADIDNDGLRDLLSHNFIVSPLYYAVSGPPDWRFEELAGFDLCLTKGTGASAADLKRRRLSRFLRRGVRPRTSGRRPRQ